MRKPDCELRGAGHAAEAGAATTERAMPEVTQIDLSIAVTRYYSDIFES